MAIFHARRSGRGQVVDLGLYQIGVRMQEEVVIQHHRTGAVATRMGTESPTVVPANVYPTRDGGWIAVSGAGDQPFVRLCEADRGAGGAEGPALRHAARRGFEHRADVRRARRRLDRPARPRRGRGALRRVRRGGHRDPLGRRHRGRRARAGARAICCPCASESGRDVHRARAGAEALAHAGPEPGRGAAPRASTPRPCARRWPRSQRGAASARCAPVRPRTSPRRRASQRRARSPASACSISRSGSPGPVAATILARVRRRRHHGRAAGQRRARPGPPAVPAVTNRNKRSLALDVRAPEGRDGLPRPRARERRHRGELPSRHPRALGPRPRDAPRRQPAPRPAALLGIRPDGPYAARAAFNPVGLAFGGATYLNGWPDRPPAARRRHGGRLLDRALQRARHARRAAPPRRGRAGAGGRHGHVRGRRCA